MRTVCGRSPRAKDCCSDWINCFKPWRNGLSFLRDGDRRISSRRRNSAFNEISCAESSGLEFDLAEAPCWFLSSPSPCCSRIFLRLRIEARFSSFTAIVDTRCWSKISWMPPRAVTATGSLHRVRAKVSRWRSMRSGKIVMVLILWKNKRSARALGSGLLKESSVSLNKKPWRETVKVRAVCSRDVAAENSSNDWLIAPLSEGCPSG